MAEDRRPARRDQGGAPRGRSTGGRSSGGDKPGGRGGSSAARSSGRNEGRGGSPSGGSRGGQDRRGGGPRSGGERREGGPRSGGERREGGPRSGGDRREGGPRSGGDRRDSAPRSGGDRRDSGSRSGGDRREGPRQYDKDRPGRKSDWKRPKEDQRDRTVDQARYDGPELPEHITGKELDRSVAAQLKGLPEKLALRVARHLAAAGELVDDDPEVAYQHTLAAKARAGRLAVVREAVGEAAYASGHYAESLAELRAAKRMNGATAYLPIMADCHRALGHPEQAIKLAQSPSVRGFIPEAKAEMTIVEAGARRDLGQFDAALRTLELAPLNSKSRGSWVVRLRYAYADTLEAAGREAEALEWFHRTNAIDSDEITDAALRADALERKLD